MQTSRAVKPREEVMVASGSGTRVHAYVVSRLKSDADGRPLYLVRDDSGIPRIVRDTDMQPATTGPILVAEEHILSVQQQLALRFTDDSQQWVLDCIQALDKALYELSKPEAANP